MDTNIKVLEKQVRDRPRIDPFHCTLIDSAVVIPCQITECVYKVRYERSNNCLLIYMREQEVDRLKPEEICFLTGTPQHTVQGLINSAIYKLRNKAVNNAQEEDELSKELLLIKNKLFCCVCEEPIRKHNSSLVIEKLGLSYCSKTCKRFKPPKIIEIESKSGLEITKVLKWASTKFQTLFSVEQALGINRWLLCESIEKFLSSDCEEFFPKLREVRKNRRNFLVRRTGHKPHWIDNVLEPTKKVALSFKKRYGPPKIDMSEIQSLMEHAIKNL